MKTVLLTKIRTKIGLTVSKLSTCYQVNDKAKFKHNHDTVYHGTCPETDCPENYIGETAQRISDRVNPAKAGRGGGGGATSSPTFFEDAYLSNA